MSRPALKAMAAASALLPGDRMVRMKQIDARIVGDHQAIKAPLVPQHVRQEHREAWQGSLSMS